MNSRRVNNQHRESQVPEKEQTEAVLSISALPDNDDILNATTGHTETTASSLPRPDDDSIMQPLPAWMAAAIHNNEELKVTNDEKPTGDVAEQIHSASSLNS